MKKRIKIALKNISDWIESGKIDFDIAMIIFLAQIVIISYLNMNNNDKSDEIKQQSELIQSQKSMINQLDSINDFLTSYKITRYTIIEKDTVSN